jgi:hypothetical protein
MIRRKEHLRDSKGRLYTIEAKVDLKTCKFTVIIDHPTNSEMTEDDIIRHINFVSKMF